jgi:hypothetical protein
VASAVAYRVRGMRLALSGEVPEGAGAGPRPSPDFFAEHRTTLLAAEYLVGLASVLMVWFWGTLRSALARAEGGTGDSRPSPSQPEPHRHWRTRSARGSEGTIAYGAPPRRRCSPLPIRIGYVAFQAGAFLFSAFDARDRP